jgi:hypothetical protein
MPGSKRVFGGPHAAPAAAPRGGRRIFALVVIDIRPLQRAAWAEFHTARKRHDKSAHDLHRHEQVDTPAYDAWVHRTFPIFVTTLRELHEEVFRKARQVEMVQELADLTGRSVRKLWREQKEAAANPQASGDPFGDEFGDDADDPEAAGREERGRDEDRGFSDEEGPSSRRRGFRSRGASEPDFEPPRAAASSREAKEIYRRLVQRLHPDRGGEWTPARERLWHEVQQAWAAGDADWLARLEMESGEMSETLGPDSPLSRLRRAIAELHAARRDTERKLRNYRGSLPWRFTLTEKKRGELEQRIEANFRHDIVFLQRQLVHLNATIASWEQERRPRRRSTRSARGWQGAFWEDVDDRD